ncbi:MAG: hypothetical protein IRZ31_14640 [Thermogemmatispora sp.]|uniref:hypothetical protein n=1 Tax=Thermogemmatispora sp. TaxID=1968838 RepID=UPI00262B147D|nr:hypothetical protein [Thermogemmatispora sp.]MBX5458130.1 hypothetical protein [Thermogemmatispora sp.]
MTFQTATTPPTITCQAAPDRRQIRPVIILAAASSVRRHSLFRSSDHSIAHLTKNVKSYNGFLTIF